MYKIACYNRCDTDHNDTSKAVRKHDNIFRLYRCFKITAAMLEIVRQTNGVKS